MSLIMDVGPIETNPIESQLNAKFELNKVVMDAFWRYDHRIQRHIGDGDVEGEKHTGGGALPMGRMLLMI